MNEIDISKNIAQYRKEKGFTIKALAQKASVTSSLLSQIEKGSANPSINTLKQIAKALEVPLFKFFIGEEIAESLVVRKENRKKIVFSDDENLSYELLTPDTKGDIEFMKMNIPADEATSQELFSHIGEEVAFVIRGKVNLHMMGKIIFLAEGDSVRIPARTEHKWNNDSSLECEVIFAVTPPSF